MSVPAWLEEELAEATGAGRRLDAVDPRLLAMGVFSTDGRGKRIGVALGTKVLDLAAALEDGRFAEASLNPLLAEGPAFWESLRQRISERLGAKGAARRIRPLLLDVDAVQLHLPIDVADYVDFYCSLEHATNLGRIFRPDGEPLQPNWRFMPVGYHGRAGTVVVSGTPVKRPWGQLRGPDGRVEFGPSARLDLEAEVGFVVGVGSELGSRVSGQAFADHVFGLVVLNDWSARDIQSFEYVPLGPFLGKSFATSISPWVVPLASLEHARIPGPPQAPPPLSHLERSEDWGLAVTLEVRLNGDVVSHPPLGALYWTPDQMLAHMTSNGAALRCGDLFATGTLSGARDGELGSLIELTWNGERPLALSDGSRRAFLEDGDEVTISATTVAPDGSPMAMGAVTGRVVASPP
jgi:fumarylacetoacetase